MKTIWELCQEYRAAMPAPKPHANHVLLAIPHPKLQGLRVGDIATDVLQTIIDVWVIPFGPFCVGSGRAKDANAITLELRDRVTCPRCKSATPMRGGICQNYGCESPRVKPRVQPGDIKRFREHLNAENAKDGSAWSNGPKRGQRKRPYGDYLYAQDREKFMADLLEWKTAKSTTSI